MTPVRELTMTDIEHLLARLHTGPIDKEDAQTIRAMAETLFYLRDLASDNATTIQQLRQILSRSSSEKMRDIFGDAQTEEHAASGKSPEQQPPSEAPPSDRKPRGHGRNG